jgi:hypothetical protein
VLCIARRTYNDDDHASLILPSGPEGSQDKNCDGDRDNGNSKTEFDIVRLQDNDNELYRETQEEEEVEL